MKKKIMMTGLCAALCVTIFFNDTICAAEYEYDKLGRVTKVTYEDKSSITYEYDANGNIVSVTRTEGEQETKPQVPQETTAPGQEGTNSEPGQEETDSALGQEETDSASGQEPTDSPQEEETKPQGDSGQGNAGQGNAGQGNSGQDSSASGNEIKRPGNNVSQTGNGNGTGETAGGGKEPSGTTETSGTEQNPSKETVTEKGIIGIDETISGTESITDEKNDTGKIGFWQKLWNGIAGFFFVVMVSH